MQSRRGLIALGLALVVMLLTAACEVFLGVDPESPPPIVPNMATGALAVVDHRGPDLYADGSGPRTAVALAMSFDGLVVDSDAFEQVVITDSLGQQATVGEEVLGEALREGDSQTDAVLELPALSVGDGEVIGLGTMTIELTTKTDTVWTVEYELGAPGAVDAAGFTAAVSDGQSLSDGQTKLLGRGIVSAASVSGSGVDVDFAVDDARVFQGQLLFFDSDKQLIAFTDIAFTDEQQSWLNDAPLQVDGATNSATAKDNAWNAVTDNPDATDARYVRVVLFDGDQLLATDAPRGAFLHSSISDLNEVGP